MVGQMNLMVGQMDLMVGQMDLEAEQVEQTGLLIVHWVDFVAEWIVVE